MTFDLAIVLLMLAAAVAMFEANRSQMGGASPQQVLATLLVIHAFLGLFIANTATTVLMAPVVLAIAKDLGASPYPFACHRASLVHRLHDPHFLARKYMVVGPGQYSFGDFVKIDVPCSIIAATLTGYWSYSYFRSITD